MSDMLNVNMIDALSRRFPHTEFAEKWSDKHQTFVPIWYPPGQPNKRVESRKTIHIMFFIDGWNAAKTHYRRSNRG